MTNPQPIQYFSSPSFFFRFLIFTLFSLLSTQPVYATGGIVEALKMPAWLDRNNTMLAIKPGMQLQSGDRLRSGAGAGLQLKMEDGSLLKMGENTALFIESMIPAEEEEGYFEAVFNVPEGIFRLISTAFASMHKRQIEVHIGSIATDLRAADILGKSSKQTDVLCLIEGKISAHRQGEPDFEMQQPMTTYVVPENKPALPVSPVTANQFTSWTRKTELNAGEGILSKDGKWAVNLLSSTNKSSLKPVLKALNTSGYGAFIEPATIKGRQWYRLRISGFNSREDASAFAGSIKGKYGIPAGWIIHL